MVRSLSNNEAMPETFTFEEAAPETFSFEQALMGEEQPARLPHKNPNLVSTTAGGPPMRLADISASEIVDPLKDAALAIPKGLNYAGNISKAAVGDIAAGVGGATQFAGNVPSAVMNEDLPMDEMLKQAAEEDKMRGQFPTAATVGKVSGGLASILPSLPAFAGLPATLGKAALAGYTAKMIADVPGAAKRLGTEYGKTVAEQDPDVISSEIADLAQTTAFSLLAGIGAKREMLHLGDLPSTSAQIKGAPNASSITSPEGVSLPEVRQQVGQEAPLQQQGQAATARPPEATQAQIPLSGEYRDLLEPHWDENTHVTGTLERGQVAVADHDTGKVIVDPEQFKAFVDNDLKGMSPKEKANAVATMFDEENIHLKTNPEDADKYEASLSPFEKSIFTRNYLRGNVMDLSPRNLGFEVIRKRVQQARGMTPSEFIGLALKERWTAKSLDALAEMVGKIRRLRNKELNANQKAILDKVLANIGAARNAVAPQPSKEDEREYVEGPFAMRKAKPDVEEGKVRLYRGHDGGEGGAYWSSDKTYASRMGPKLEYVDVPSDQVGDHAVRLVEGSGTPNAFKLPVEMTKGAKPLESEGVPVHSLDVTSDALLKRKPGDVTVQELLSLPDDEVQRLFEGNQKRGNALQYDSVLAGMKLLPDEGEALKPIRDRLHQEGMRKLEASVKAGQPVMPPEFGKVIWLNGAIEGALRKGPNYESVVTGRRGGPAALRKKGKPGEQEEMFGAVTQKGGPGGEDVQPVSAAQAGATEFPPEQKIFAKDMAFGPKSYGAASLPFRKITPSEAKSAAELSKFLTADARKEGSDLPVSASRRLTVLFDKTDGSVHLVSTYRGDNVARMVDPRIAGKERNSRPVGELLNRYQPVASVLLSEPRQGFHQKFDSMADFQEKFGNEAQAMAREQSTGTEGIPQTRMSQTPIREPGQVERGIHPSEPFQLPKEQREPNFTRPTTEELKAFHDFFGDNPPSDALMFSRRIEKEAATASRAMINGLRKLVRIERGQTRGLSEGEALGRVLDKLQQQRNPQ